jgi:hypothetical protein
VEVGAGEAVRSGDVDGGHAVHTANAASRTGRCSASRSRAR